MSKEGIKHIKKELEKFSKNNHPAANHLEKILENPSNKTNVLKHGIAAHCYECSHDSVDPAGSHPKKCTITKCPFYEHRPGAKKGEGVEKKELTPERKAQLQANAEKARAGRMKFKEALDVLENKINPLFLKKKEEEEKDEKKPVQQATQKINPLFTKSEADRKKEEEEKKKKAELAKSSKPEYKLGKAFTKEELDHIDSILDECDGKCKCGKKKKKDDEGKDTPCDCKDK